MYYCIIFFIQGGTIMAKALHGFDDEKRRNPLTIVEIIIIVVCALLIISMLCCYFLFSKTGSAPNIFGKMIYVTEATNMEPNIPAGSAVFASSENLSFLKTGDVVLFRTAGADNEQITGVLRIQGVETDDAGKVYYTLRGDANAPTETIKLPKENILGQCKTYDEVLGAVISFATSTMGLLTVVIIPCVLLIVFQIIRIVRIKSDYEYANDKDDDDDDDSFMYADEDDDDYIFNFDIKKKPVAEAQPVVEQTPAPVVTDFAQASSVETVEEKIETPFTKPEPAERPVNKAYVDNDGAGQYHKNPAPTATTEDFRNSIRNDTASEIPSFRKRATRTSQTRPTNNFTADDLLASVEASQRSINNSMNSVPVEEPVKQPARQQGYEIPRLNEPVSSPFSVYQKEEEVVPPPAVEKPVDITIPTNAAIPEETIAPPPKKSTNKTVEELMRMIDEAN